MSDKVQTTAELDGLPIGAVVRDATGRGYVVKAGSKGIVGVLRVDGAGVDTAWIGARANVTLPATLVYSPAREGS